MSGKTTLQEPCSKNKRTFNHFKFEHEVHLTGHLDDTLLYVAKLTYLCLLCLFKEQRADISKSEADSTSNGLT